MIRRQFPVSKTTAAKYHHFVNKPWFCKLDLWFNFTRGLKITITFTHGRTYPGIKIIISSISFWPEARIRGQQIPKELSWTWKGTWPQISFQPAGFELMFVLLKYELATVGIRSWMVWGSCFNHSNEISPFRWINPGLVNLNFDKTELDWIL